MPAGRPFAYAGHGAASIAAHRRAACRVARLAEAAPADAKKTASGLAYKVNIAHEDEGIVKWAYSLCADNPCALLP